MLGSVRWAEVYEQLYALSTDQPVLTAGSRALLTVLREQGDFGPMDFHPELLTAWARRDEAERALSQILRQLIPSTTEMLRIVVGGAADDGNAADVIMKGPTQPVYVSKGRVLVKFRVREQERFLGPVLRAPERRRDLQRPSALSGSGSTLPRALIDAVALGHGADMFGHSWKLTPLLASELRKGAEVHAGLEHHIRETTAACRSAGLFDRLEAQPETLVSPAELPEESEPTIEPWLSAEGSAE